MSLLIKYISMSIIYLLIKSLSFYKIKIALMSYSLSKAASKADENNGLITLINLCRSLAQYIRTRPTHHGISGGSFLALERVITLVTVGTGCVFTGLLLAVKWGDPGWWRHGIVCSLPHSSPFSKRHPTQRGQQFQNFPAHFLPPPTKITSDHTKFAYSPVREPLYK